MRVLTQNEVNAISGGALDNTQMKTIISLTTQMLVNIAYFGGFALCNSTPTSFVATKVVIPLINIMAVAVGSEIANRWLTPTEEME